MTEPFRLDFLRSEGYNSLMNAFLKYARRNMDMDGLTVLLPKIDVPNMSENDIKALIFRCTCAGIESFPIGSRITNKLGNSFKVQDQGGNIILSYGNSRPIRVLRHAGHENGVDFYITDTLIRKNMGEKMGGSIGGSHIKAFVQNFQQSLPRSNECQIRFVEEYINKVIYLMDFIRNNGSNADKTNMRKLVDWCPITCFYILMYSGEISEQTLTGFIETQRSSPRMRDRSYDHYVKAMDIIISGSENVLISGGRKFDLSQLSTVISMDENKTLGRDIIVNHSSEPLELIIKEARFYIHYFCLMAIDPNEQHDMKDEIFMAANLFCTAIENRTNIFLNNTSLEFSGWVSTIYLFSRTEYANVNYRVLTSSQLSANKSNNILLSALENSNIIADTSNVIYVDNSKRGFYIVIFSNMSGGGCEPSI